MVSGNLNSGGGKTDFGALFKDEFAVILLQGRNSFGDMIYSYVEVTVPNIKRLHAALASGEDFTPSDFGTILAAGKGVPPESLRKEMESDNPALKSLNPTVFPAKEKSPVAAMEKKSWDEY